MASTGALVVGGVVIGGVAYLLWKKSQAKKNSDACKIACTAVDVYTGQSKTDDTCLAACDAIGAAIYSVSAAEALDDGYDKFQAEISRRQKINDTANGATSVPLKYADLYGYVWPDGANPEHGKSNSQWNAISRPLQGKTLRYSNGCVPFFGAPGFSKCATGTLDMYATAINAGLTDPFPGFSEDKILNAIPVNVAPPTDEKAFYAHPPRLVKSSMMTGLTGDAASAGPFPDVGGGLFWVIAGKRVSCGTGSAPLTAVNARNGVRDQRTGADQSACTPLTGPSWTAGYTPAPYSGPAPVKCGAPGQPPCGTPLGDQIAVTCPPPPTMTWDPAGHWRRLNAGEVQSLFGSPCASSQTGISTSSLDSHNIGAL